MKDYDCCNYCLSLGIEDSCPCYNKDLKDIINDFVCDFHIPNYAKIVDEIRADERAKVFDEVYTLIKEIDTDTSLCRTKCPNLHKSVNCTMCILERAIEKMKERK